MIFFLRSLNYPYSFFLLLYYALANILACLLICYMYIYIYNNHKDF